LRRASSRGEIGRPLRRRLARDAASRGTEDEDADEHRRKAGDEQ
jgi:hypothetical protein